MSEPSTKTTWQHPAAPVAFAALTVASLTLGTWFTGISPGLSLACAASLDPDSPFPLREAAKAAGVRFSVLFRVRQGRMPDPADRAAIETWLETYSADSSPEPTPGAGDSR